MKFIKPSIVLFLLGTTLSSYADDINSNAATIPVINTANKEVDPWLGTNASFGGVLNTGNAASENMTGGANIQYATAPWTYTAQGTFQRAESEEEGLTAQRLFVLGQAQYNFNQKQFSYTQLNYTNDRFSGYSYIVNWQLGYGQHYALARNMSLDVFSGPGIRASETTDGNQSTLPSLQVGANYSWPINDKTTFTEQLQTTAASNDIYTSSQTALTTSLTDNLSFTFGLLISNDSKPQPGKAAINSTTTVQLVYNF